ncbi:MAG: ATP-binding protein [Deltaproteobacteria bacterium]|nr:ATP-binding protein [Deltaproteobacteria bacterium]MBW2138165.1 ATP-binding protein [Deltaproteobacteria bacterium]
MADLLLFNPWWEKEQSIELDPYISAFDQSSIQWLPEVLNEIDLDRDAVYTLRGPRQVGKTTLVKIMIRGLLKSGVPPQAVFYYSCDLVPGAGELFDIIREYHEFSFPLRLKRRYVFLDEISLVNDWQHAIKQVIDLGWGRNLTLVLTGSSAMDIKRGAERLPGRRGNVIYPDRVLLPMSFAEFVEKCSDLSPAVNDFSLRGLMLLPGEVKRLRVQTHIFLPKLSALLGNYLSVGGFPLAVEQFLNTGSVPAHVIETYLTVIRSDFEKIKKSRILLRQVLVRMLGISGNPTSWQGLAKSVDTPSYRTVREYSEVLADSFLVAILYFLEKNRRRANPNKQKKFYFSDPLIQSLAVREAGLPRFPEQGKVVEGIVAMHLIRRFEQRIFEGLGSVQNVFYWRSTKGKEIDFVILDEDELLPVEVKYQGVIGRSDYSTMKRVFAGGILVTKDRFFHDQGVTGIPAPVFLLLLR